MAGSVTTTKTASWGITTPLGSAVVTGVITDWDDGDDAITAPEQNEKGSTINETQYDRHYTATMTVQVAALVNKPQSGKTVSVGSQTWFVRSARVTESNTAYRKIQVNLERWELCNAVEVTSGISSAS